MGYSCSLCEKSFSRLYNLKRHIKTVHGRKRIDGFQKSAFHAKSMDNTAGNEDTSSASDTETSTIESDVDNEEYSSERSGDESNTSTTDDGDRSGESGVGDESNDAMVSDGSIKSDREDDSDDDEESNGEEEANDKECLWKSLLKINQDFTELLRRSVKRKKRDVEEMEDLLEQSHETDDN